ncbi:hypothetical protein K1W69_01845 [Hoeflea sp. WL0058]|uniref:Uncharacterized protein n=1 Tax=Flavimaribacter sediminis TaxID=2865987 RepID=A0AAE2ZJ54_9HYPH|nr:hypothetical protein [Flavimaribacter sediminis]MBW8635911.1 hypothetical protein [Flavimaribacter sediminis]
MSKDIDKLRRKLEKRNARIDHLERLVERQMTLLDRYDRTAGRLKSRAEASPLPMRELSSLDYERLIGLLDRAVARAEQLTGDKQKLQSSLDHTLGLLDRALSAQERMSKAVANGGGEKAASPAGRDIDATVAKYDAMLDRSLAALEAAHKANHSQKQEIEQRDRYLNQTLDALQKAIRMQETMSERLASASGPATSNADDGEAEVTIARYDAMLERSLAALEAARRENGGWKQEIEQRDRFLNQTLEALQNAIRMQEDLSQRYISALQSQGGRAPAEVETGDVDATIARYDTVLEQSLAALEKANQSNKDRKKEIDQRDRLLSRTLDALQNLIEQEGAAPKERGVFSRFFG